MTPVERMARSIREADIEQVCKRYPDVPARAVEMKAEELAEDHAAMARAALMAIREPSEAMKAAFDRDFDAWHNEKIEDPYHLWKAMIDAALSES